MNTKLQSVVRAVVIAPALALALALAACGGGEASCEDVGARICAEACACTGGGQCQISDGGATISFDSEDDCVALFVGLGCMGGGDPSVDFAACDGALDSAQCVDAGDGTQALESPAECAAEE